MCEYTCVFFLSSIFTIFTDEFWNKTKTSPVNIAQNTYGSAANLVGSALRLFICLVVYSKNKKCLFKFLL